MRRVVSVASPIIQGGMDSPLQRSAAPINRRPCEAILKRSAIIVCELLKLREDVWHESKVCADARREGSHFSLH